MKKILIIILSSVILTTSLGIPTRNIKAETLTVSGNNDIQPREVGVFRVLASSGTYVYSERNELSYRVYYASYNTILERMEYGPTYDSYGRAWYKVRTFDSYYSGWILASTGRKE